MLNNNDNQEMLTDFNKNRMVNFHGNKQVELVGSDDPNSIEESQDYEIRTDFLHFR